MVNVAVRDAGLSTFTPLKVTPVPLATTAVAPVAKPLPPSDTEILALRGFLFGEMEESVGTGGGAVPGLTVNVTALLVPAMVVTVTERSPAGAVLAIVKVAVIEPSLTTLTELMVIPLPAHRQCRCSGGEAVARQSDVDRRALRP
jgi:hypothetical protein